MTPDGLPELLVPDAAAWRGWLQEHHDSARGVWLVLTKKGGTVTSLDYEQAVGEALCFGWIDGQGRRRDDQTSLQRMTPRGPRSAWSSRNVDRVARLEREGRMTASGRAAVEAAKADGRWDRAYDGQAALVVPDDLRRAVAANPEAQRMFDVLTRTNLFAIVYRLDQARKPETRARNIERFVAMLSRHETPHPQKRRPQ